MELLRDVAAQVKAASIGKHDVLTTYGELVAGMTDLRHVQSQAGELVLTDNGFRQLVNDRLKFNYKSFDTEHLSPDTKLAILRDLSAARNDSCLVRVNGNSIDAVLSESYQYFDNDHILEATMEMMTQGHIPNNIKVMSKHISPDGRNMHLRLVNPDWDFYMPEGDGQKKFMTNLIIGNNEHGNGAFRASVAITRHECLNSTIGKSLFAVEHKGRFEGDKSKFLEALINAFMLVKSYGLEMQRQMEDMQSIPVEHPGRLLERVAAEMAAPVYAIESAQGYLQSGSVGNPNTVYAVTQALAAGVRTIAASAPERVWTGTKSNRQDWERRASFESKLWVTAIRVATMAQEGRNLEEWYLSPVERALEVAANYTEGYQRDLPGAATIAEGIRRLEVSEFE